MYMLNNVGNRTLLCGTSVLNWHCVDVLFLNGVCDEFENGVWDICLFAIVRSGGLVLLKPVAMVFMLCSRSKTIQPASGWTSADICTNCVYSILAPEIGAQFRFLSDPVVAPCRLPTWFTKAKDVESNPGPTTHTSTHSSNFDL